MRGASTGLGWYAEKCGLGTGEASPTLRRGTEDPSPIVLYTGSDRLLYMLLYDDPGD